MKLVSTRTSRYFLAVSFCMVLIVNTILAGSGRPTHFEYMDFYTDKGYVEFSFYALDVDDIDEEFKNNGSYVSYKVGSSSNWTNIIRIGQTLSTTHFNIRDDDGHGSAEGQILINRNWCNAYNDPSGENLSYVVVRYVPSPDEYGKELTFKVTGDFRVDGGDGIVDVDFRSSVNIPSIPVPSGLECTTSRCNNIKVNWDFDDDDWESPGTFRIVATLPPSTTIRIKHKFFYKYVIQKREKGTSTWATLNSNYSDVEYTDSNTGDAGTEYEYRVAAKLIIKAYQQTYDISVSPTEPTEENYLAQLSGTGDYTMEMTGHTKAPPPLPMISLTNTGCDGSVSIQLLSATDDDNLSYKIWRRPIFENASGNPMVPIFYRLFPNGQNIYIDEQTTVNETYSYIVLATDNCSNTSEYDNSDYQEIIAAAPPVPPDNINAIPDNDNQEVEISWTDRSTSETGFIVERKAPGESQPYIIEVDADATSLIDNDLLTCKNYVYTVKAKNDCALQGVANDEKDTIQLLRSQEDLRIEELKASKGYYNTKVKLQWTSESPDIQYFEIYRKPLNSTADPVMVERVTGLSNIFDDFTAEAGIFYKYSIIGYSECNDTTMTTNTKRDIGYRSPEGIVNGKITYEGGIAVKDAKVIASRTSGSNGKSLLFNGINACVRVTDTTNWITKDTEFTIEAWVRPVRVTGTQYLFSKDDMFEMYLQDSIVTFDFGPKSLSADSMPLQVNNYSHVAFSYDSDTMRIFVNGEYCAGRAKPNLPAQNENNFFIGVFNGTDKFYQGNIDEIRVWNKALKPEDIKLNHTRVLNPGEDGIAAMWHCDEGAGNFIYDCSYSNPEDFNEHHGRIVSAAFSDLIPTKTQLGVWALTDENGDYTITGIRYNSSGENFTIQPILGIHNFDPGNKVLYIGDNISIHNNIDFTDISAFDVSGYVFFHGCDCPTAGAGLYIDGEAVFEQGQPVTTDGEGFFNIKVPIGEHRISVYTPNHEYSKRYFPSETQLHNFQKNEVLPDFIDSTYITVVGRVAGGDREGDKPPMAHDAVNNIGQATILFKSELRSGCKTASVTTDSLTGNYSIDLPPLDYIIPDFELLHPDSVDEGFEENDKLKISMAPPKQERIDTIYANPNDTIWERIDTIRYNVERNFIYYEAPELFVTLPMEDTITYEPNEGEPIDFDVRSNPFGFPMFKQYKKYTATIKLIEKYINLDSGAPVYDTVPVPNGRIVASNNIKGSVDTLALKGKTLTYNFRAGDPNISLPFTNTLELTATTPKHEAKWRIEGIVIGYKSAEGTDFYTNGPDVVTNIIRDPPGDNSYAYINKGSTSSYIGSLSLSQVGTAVFNSKINLGADFSVGLGMQIHTETESNFIGNLSAGMGFTEEGDWYVTNTFNEGFSTNSAPDRIGAESDLYVGESMNYFMGMAENIQIMDTATCNKDLTECNDNFVINGYKIGRIKSLLAMRDSVQTMFVYDEYHIVNSLIPTIKEVRNQLFNNYPTKYIPFLHADDPMYGTNNDDPRWGDDKSSDDPIATDREDNYGKSYKFDGNNGEEVDSVRLYNQQIRLWEEAIALNEEMKVKSTESIQNVSFDGGPSYEYSHTSADGGSLKISCELFQTQESYIKTGANVNGTGLELKVGYKIELRENFMEGGSWNSETTYGYVLHDDDVGDYFSVDVMKPKDGFGPVFKLRGGRSACPHEGVTRSKYYTESTSEAVVISDGTLRRDKPVIKIEDTKYAEKNIVPSDEPAIFELQLGNESESYDDRLYTMRVLEDTNPNGARISIDGLSANGREFLVPARDILRKELVVMKGAQHYDYENIGIVLYSACQFLVSGVETIADTIWFSVHFIPTCTDVKIDNPDNQWVINNSFNDTMEVKMNDYDIDFTGFERLSFQYKPSSESQWVPTQSFYNDTTLMGPSDEEIPKDKSYTLFPWDISQIPDGEYDIRSKSFCLLSENTSDVLTGIIDRINPVPFGTPSPGDGILSPNDDILIRFNEPIYIGSLTKRNFDVRGVPNGAEQIYLHNACVLFDGTNDYAQVFEGLNLNNSYTLEAWVRADKTGEMVILSQGPTANQSVQLGINSSGNFTLWHAGEAVSIDETIETGKWYHIAATYDASTHTVELFAAKDADTYKKTQTISSSHTETGQLYFGASTSGNLSSFKGGIHDIRVWNRAHEEGEIAGLSNVRLSGRENGLMGYWPMDEVNGNLAEDIARNRHATIVSGTWQVSPSGFAMNFDGASSFITSPYPDLAFTDEMDVTIEFWFKGSAQSGDVGLLSTGKGDLSDTNPIGWSVWATQDGKIRFTNNGETFEAINISCFDNNWHHFTMVINRMGNTNTYIDGELKQSITSSNWSGFGGSQLCIGARASVNGSTVSNNDFFNGSIDEVRVWNLARVEKQVTRDIHNRLSGDEFGLRSYFPFEEYIEDSLIYIQNIKNLSGNLDTLVLSGAAHITSDVPLVKLQRPIENLKFTWTVNNDEIVINTTEDAGRIENVTLDITVRDIRDMHGNMMQSPKTWIAYVDKNQMVWDDNELFVDKEVYKSMEFEAQIMNTGGASKEFSIENLPEWLTADPMDGVLAPLSDKTITFTVNQGINIGSYEEDIRLHTDFGFDEPMLLHLNVHAIPPDWQVDPLDYENTMSIIGQIIVNNTISNDPNDLVAAFCGDTCRGVGQLEYLPEYDRYEVFFDIYSNTLMGDNIELRVWDASTGLIYTGILPEISFTRDDVLGLPSTPYDIIAENQLEQEFQFVKGWNWFSVNLNSTHLDSLSHFFTQVDTGQIYTLMFKNGSSQYTPEEGWVSGNLFSMSNNNMYKLKTDVPFTQKVPGSKINPVDFEIQLTSGWNWIGYIPMMNLPVNDALAYYSASESDFIKSQKNFAIYDNRMGWLGSLKYLQPGQGYMLYSASDAGFYYPEAALFKSDRKDDPVELPQQISNWNFDEHQYAQSMSMIAGIYSNGLNISDNCILGAFIDEKCVGYAVPDFISATGYHVFFLTVFSNGGNETIHFKAFQTGDNTIAELNESLAFHNDSLSGSIDEPFALTGGQELMQSVDGAASQSGFMNIYPNPFNDNVFIHYYLPNPTTVDISVFDVAGRKIATLLSNHQLQGHHSVEWKTSATDKLSTPPGIYFIGISANNFKHIAKIIKK